MLYTIREILSNRIEINFEASKSDTPHYNITPYSFVPKIGRKLVTHEYVDMGQGLLECISEIYDQDINREQ